MCWFLKLWSHVFIHIILNFYFMFSALILSTMISTILSMFILFSVWYFEEKCVKLIFMSILFYFKFPGDLAYCMSKAALDQFTRCVSLGKPFDQISKNLTFFKFVNIWLKDMTSFLDRNVNRIKTHFYLSEFLFFFFLNNMYQI